MTVSFQDIYLEIKQTKAKVELYHSTLFIQVYITKSEVEPLTWSRAHFCTTSGYAVNEDFDHLVKHMEIDFKNKEITGYKILTVAMNALDLSIPPEYLESYCLNKWQPVKKVYVNGPNKSFIATKGKHYV